MIVAPKKRKNMKHLSEMNDQNFILWMRGAKDTINLSWKLDGFFIRVGKDAAGVPFFQTARSPVLYDPMDVIWNSLEKGYDHEGMTRAENYFHLVKTLWGSKLMASLPTDSAYECEIFDKAASILDKETGLRRFVNIPYEDKFFRRDIAVFIYRRVNASAGDVLVNGYPDSYEFLEDTISIHGTRFSMDLDLSYFREVCSQFSDAEYFSLKSLKHADRALKLATRDKVMTIKEQFCQYVLSKVQPQMGENFEGVVITVNNIEYKITTDYFRELIALKRLLGG